MPLTVEIVTVERQLLEESGIDEVIAPGVEGQLAVLVDPLLPFLGLLRVRRTGCCAQRPR